MIELDSGGDKDFPLRDFNKVLFAHCRYCLTTDPADISQVSPSTHSYLPHIPGDKWVPVIIKAPISSVKVIEAILKTEQPFQIYRTRHVPRRRVTHC